MIMRQRLSKQHSGKDPRRSQIHREKIRATGKVQKTILPFITQYNPLVPNLEKVLMSKWYIIEKQSSAEADLLEDILVIEQNYEG